MRSRSSTLENIPSIHRDAGECILAIIASDATKSKVLEACAQLMEAKHKVIQGAHSAKKLRASTSLVDRMKRRVSDVASIKACAACLSAMAQDNECRVREPLPRPIIRAKRASLLHISNQQPPA